MATVFTLLAINALAVLIFGPALERSFEMRKASFGELIGLIVGLSLFWVVGAFLMPTFTILLRDLAYSKWLVPGTFGVLVYSCIPLARVRKRREGASRLLGFVHLLFFVFLAAGLQAAVLRELLPTSY